MVQYASDDNLKNAKQSKYVSKKADKNGYINYSADEHAIWHDLFTRQNKIIPHYACQEFIDGLDILNLSADHIPQPLDVSKQLFAATGWVVETVPALISFDKFFLLLSQRKFPAASFIRSRDELDYLQEPDIFHEIYGHCPMLTNPVFANFTQKYGELGVANPSYHFHLARLYWFTVEFGLINTEHGLRNYGGGILSSFDETIYALESDIPQRRHFRAIDALRTPYRIDIKQVIYYVIDSYEQVFDLLSNNFIGLLDQARALGDFAPEYPTEK